MLTTYEMRFIQDDPELLAWCLNTFPAWPRHSKLSPSESAELARRIHGQSVCILSLAFKSEGEPDLILEGARLVSRSDIGYLDLTSDLTQSPSIRAIPPSPFFAAFHELLDFRPLASSKGYHLVISEDSSGLHASFRDTLVLKCEGGKLDFRATGRDATVR